MTPEQYQAYYECRDRITAKRLIADGWTKELIPGGSNYAKNNVIAWRLQGRIYSIMHHGDSVLRGRVKTMGQLRHAVAAMGVK